MDWEKAKNIIIVIFLVLNIFLSYNLLQEKWAPAVSNEQLNATEDILKERGIKLNVKIPATSGNSSKLAFEGVAEFDSKKVFSKLLGTDTIENSDSYMLINGDKQISIENAYAFLYTNKSPQGDVNLKSSKDTEKYLLKFIGEAGLPTEDLVLDSTDRFSDYVRMTLVQKKGKYKLFDNKIEATVTESGISQLHCSMQKPSSTQKKVENILPAYKVLLKNLEQMDGIVISSIDLGYTISETSNEMAGHYDKLYWRVGRADNGDYLFFDAATGDPKKE